MFGKCKVCEEKDKRIAQLTSEVAYLRELASPARLTVQMPEVVREADLILSGATAQTSEDSTPDEALTEIEAEANRLLNGTY